MSKYLNGTSLYSAVNSGLTSSYNFLTALYKGESLTLENLTSAMSNSTVLTSSYGSFASYLMTNFASIDKDNDGVLSASDIQSYMATIYSQGLTREQIITLGSSAGLSSSLQETVLAHFDEIDANNDNRVTTAEIQAYNIKSDIYQQKVEDLNRNISQMSLYTDDLPEYEGSLMDYKYLSDDD